VGCGLKAQTQEGEQKKLEAGAGPWTLPFQEDLRTPTLSRKAEKIPD